MQWAEFSITCWRILIQSFSSNWWLSQGMMSRRSLGGNTSFTCPFSIFSHLVWKFNEEEKVYKKDASAKNSPYISHWEDFWHISLKRKLIDFNESSYGQRNFSQHHVTSETFVSLLSNKVYSIFCYNLQSKWCLVKCYVLYICDG